MRGSLSRVETGPQPSRNFRPVAPLRSVRTTQRTIPVKSDATVDWRRWAAAFALLLFALSRTGYAATPDQAVPLPDASDRLFNAPTVVRIQIEIPAEGMNVLREYYFRGRRGWRGAPTAERKNVAATVREGGRIYRDVAIHLKGSAGSFRPLDDKPSFTLNFDKILKGQTFHGLEKISLNNSVQDPTYLNEKICRELFAAAGVPVPRADHAVVELNGRQLGLYVLTEGFNQQFLKRHFKKANGNFYDGGFLTDVTEELALHSGHGPKDHSDLRALAEAAMEPENAGRWKRLEKVLDADRFISMLAMEMLTCHWDGYALNRNNYRVYHDPASDKMVFMPHGLDQMFGVRRASPAMSILPRMRGLVAQSILETAEGRRRYLERSSQLLTNVLKADAITNRVNRLATRIRPLLAEIDPQEALVHDQYVADFCERIAERAVYAQRQLDARREALKFEKDGPLKRAEWNARSEFGKPTFSRTALGGRAALHIAAMQGSSVGAWRTKVFLEAGAYRLEGKVKTHAVSVDPGDRRGGAGFRIGGRRQNVVGTVDWTPLDLDFVVPDGLGEIELACELRAAEGEAWFDAESLRIIRR